VAEVVGKNGSEHSVELYHGNLYLAFHLCFAKFRGQEESGWLGGTFPFDYKVRSEKIRT
jgi:hypothetical protein